MRKQPKNTLHFHIKCPQKWEGRGGSRFPDMTASFLSIWFDIVTLPLIYRVDQKSWRVEFKLLFPRK